MAGTMDIAAGLPPLARRRRKRPDIIAELIRERIVKAGLRPGDRVPGQWLNEDGLKASRGTLREAMKVLEAQGLVTSKTGPGGGVFVTAVAVADAIGLLDNLFLFQPPSIADIYTLRKLIEPELAASLAGRLSNEAFETLRSTIRLYEAEPGTAEEEYRQRLAELDFHAELARHADNRLLGFTATFLLSLLRDTTECRSIYGEPNPALRESGLHYQVRLLRAIKLGDGAAARQIMAEHMAEAERYMLWRASTRTLPRSAGRQAR